MVGVVCCNWWVGVSGSSMSMASSSSAQETEDFDLSEKDESWFICLWWCCVGLAFGLLFPGVTSVKGSSGSVVMNS